MRWSLRTIGIGCAGLLGLAVASIEAHAACPQTGTSLMVETSTHQLVLCKEGQSQGQYTVALGSGGVDKFKEGDKKTPLGEYDLGEPRPSSKFAIFIPVGYPTELQRKEGRTGSEIGVHGPPEMWSWLGDLTTWGDWTKGCIAVGTVQAIQDISEWVRREHVTSIILK
ncbi:MAG: L,D-transpeptidase family protein [Nitrospira sp.]|nr:L,D-transpeptidase family protein [Nitrospira sp.]